MAVAVPHFAYPFQVINGTAATVEQNSIDDIGLCVEVLVTTVVGQRVVVPTYGVPDPVFSELTDGAAKAWLGAISLWEPRANAIVNDSVSSADDLLRQLSVSVGRANVGHL